jgi:hypothetical protein
MDLKDITKFKGSFFATMAESRAVRSEQKEKDSEKGMAWPTTNPSLAFSKLRTD